MAKRKPKSGAEDVWEELKTAAPKDYEEIAFRVVIKSAHITLDNGFLKICFF